MIDWQRVKELQDEIGHDDFAEIVEIFLEEVEDVIVVIKDSAPPESLEEHLHFLKGSALNLGFSHFSKLCQSGERAAGAGAYDQIDVGNVIASYEASKREFLTALEDRPAA